MNDSDVWAERILTFKASNAAKARRVLVRLGRPHTEPGMANSWRVEIEILDAVDEPLQAHSTGEDPFHALELACHHIAGLLDRWAIAGKLSWSGGDGSGFEPWTAVVRGSHPLAAELIGEPD